MVRKASLIISLVLAFPAHAQTTNCQWFGSTWSCNTPQPMRQGGGVDWDSFNRAQEQQNQQAQQNFQNIMRAQEEREAARRELADRQVHQSHDAAMADVRRSVASKLQSGDCKGAIDLALLSGDIALAGQAKDFCAKP